MQIRNGVRALAASVATGVAIVGGGALLTAAPASAMVCNYSEEIESYSSDWQVSVPIVGSVDPFGGQRQVAHWGNCSSGKEKVKVTWKGGSKTYCVPKGDTRLGFTENDKQISGAKKTGTC
ncbi:hypothetical protein ACPEEZ_00870 [Frigoribacterium sp. 2-23]|uniref:hypothetical protein n=1 Tax=Frigoribacterium sp. 2-23 TaxID=3415006 RepID=UPI003C6FF039